MRHYCKIGYCLLLLCVVLLQVTSTFSQNNTSVKNLNAFQYVEVEPPRKTRDHERRNQTDQNNSSEITAFMEELLLEKGFLVVQRDSLGNTPTFGGVLTMPVALSKNKCLNLIWYWGYSANEHQREMKVMALNCREEVVYSNGYKVKSSTLADSHKALKILLDPILRYNYYFDEALNHQLFIPHVPSINENEETLRRYFGDNNLDKIEGIYKVIEKSMKNDPADYRIGIKNINGRFCAILLESDNNIWHPGNIKAYLEKAEHTDLYTTTYYLSDKRKIEAFAQLDGLILNISLQGEESSNTIKFIKIFPK